MKVIRYKGVNGLIQFNPSVKDMSYTDLKKAYEGKVVSIEDLAKELGIEKPKTRAKKEGK